MEDPPGVIRTLQFRPNCSSGFSNRADACVIVVLLHRYINFHFLSV